MKILYTVTRLRHCGAEKLLHSICEQLSKDFSADIEIIFFDLYAPLQPLFLEIGIPTILMNRNLWLNCQLSTRGIAFATMPDLVRSIHPWSGCKASLNLGRFFREQKFDIVHTHSSKTSILGRLAAKQAGIPIIMHTVQGLPFHEFSPSPLKALYRWAERKAGSISNKVIYSLSENPFSRGLINIYVSKEL